MLLTSVFSFFARAQDYENGVGLRGGVNSGVVGTHFTSESNAITGIVGMHPNYLSLTATFAWYKKAFDVERLNWYYGGGARLAITDANYIYHSTSPTIGLTGVIGIEYAIEDIPLAIGLDYYPTLTILPFFNYWGSDAAISIKYIF